MGVVVLLLVVLLVVAVAAWGWYSAVHRRDELAVVAKQLGLTYSGTDPFGLVGYPFALFQEGDGQGCRNVLAGTWQEVDLKEFDFWYYTESTDSRGGRTKTYHNFSCALADVPASCPRLSIGPENVFTRLADHLAMHDIEFESEDFNRAFRVKGDDTKFATACIDARMMAWLMAEAREFHFELNGSSLLCYSKRRAPKDLVPLLGALVGFRQHFPRVVSDWYPAQRG